jgi:hemin uptake protein HemP
MSNEVNNENRFEQQSRMQRWETGDVADEKQDEAHADAGAVRTPENLPEYDTGTLFAGRREIVIHHAGAAYRMKITKQGKLILNK